MRLDNHARLERLLARHLDVVVAEPEPGRTCLVRRDEVLVTASHAAHVDDRVRRWVDRREDLEDLAISRFRLRSNCRVDVCDLVMSVVGDTRHRQLGVSPNHLLRGEPSYSGGPFDTPQPAAELPAPRPNGQNGRRIRVAVLDTGIAEHPWFTGTSWFARCGPGTREVLDANLDFELDSEAGHGTFVAGVVLQQAPDVELHVERVLGSDGVCDELQLIHALARLWRRTALRGEPVDILNLSLGGYTYDDRPSPVLVQALARFGRRTVIVAAAGNNASDRPFWPAALKNVIAVAALDAEGRDRAEFSNFGWWVDACAVGERVASSFVTFDNHDGPDFAGYATWSGTSFAAPAVAGAIAALASGKDLQAADAADLVLDSANGDNRPDLGVVVRTFGGPRVP